MTMDANDLARWTRFAGKGGIGKCTAVQDCIAESPEDLMFLKDDEITVLMHLPNQTNRFLGYCEGVVGRFQGEHVRFHGKLKRPVMTKRASASVSAPASRTPTPSASVSPSPRVDLVALPPRDATDSPSLNNSTNSNPGASRRRRASSRADREILADPFDLELPNSSAHSLEVHGQGRRSGSVPRARSRSRERERERAKEKEAVAVGGSESGKSKGRGKSRERGGETSEDEKRRMTNTNTIANAIASLPPSPQRIQTATPPARSQSTDQVQSHPNSAPVSPPPRTSSRDHQSDDTADKKDERTNRRRTRIIGTIGPFTESPHSPTTDLPPPSPLLSPPPHAQSSLPASPFGASFAHASSPAPSPSPKPSPTSPLPNAQFLPTPPQDPSPPRSVQAGSAAPMPVLRPRRKSTDDGDGVEGKEKGRKRRTGIVGDWTLAVGTTGDVEVLASPSPMRVEFDVVRDADEGKMGGELHGTEEESRHIGVEKEGHTKKKVVEVEDDLGGQPTPPSPSTKFATEPKPEPESELAPTPAHALASEPEPEADAEPEAEVSSLYDRASLLSSSTHDHSLGYGRGADDTASVASGPNMDASRFGFGRHSTVSLDDGGLGFGIGLTMLQDMADADSDAEESSSGSEYEEAVRAVEAGARGGLGAADTGRVEEEDGGWATRKEDDNRSSVLTEDVPPTPRPPMTINVPAPSVESQTHERPPLDVHDPAIARSDSEHDSHLGHALPTGTSEGTVRADERAEEDGELERDRDGDEEDEDDDEEWYGADDIYDNYRYSRYSMMSKTSKRKSGYSMMSKFSGAELELESPSLPPMPYTDSRPRTLSSEDSGSIKSPISPPALDAQDRERTPKAGRHVPPPLNLAKAAPGTATLLSPPATLTPTAASSSPSGGFRPSHLHGPSPQPSPLLHSNFPSPPVSSAGGSSAGLRTPLISPSPSVATFSAAGAASALRQKLENERGPSSSTLAQARPKSEDSVRGGGIVIEDDEDADVRVTVVPADESMVVTDASFMSRKADEISEEGNVTRALAELGLGGKERDAASSPPPGSETDESAEMQADLLSTLQETSGENTSTVQVVSAPAPSTPTGSTFPLTPTQPLRFQRSVPPPEQGNPAQLPQSQPLQQQQLLAPASHLRPQKVQEPLLFFPHPNAPPPNPAVVSGQRISTYGMPPVHAEPLQPPPSPGHSSLQATLRMAAASRIGPAGVPRMTTIFGKTVIDLAAADGPVAMVWSLEPFPPEPGRVGGPNASGRQVPRRSATAGASPLSSSVTASPPPTPPPLRAREQTPSPVPPSPLRDVAGPGENEARGSRVLPRANFQPQVNTSRPRSRSFSGFTSELAAPPLTARSSEEGSEPSRVASMQSMKAGPRGDTIPPPDVSSRHASVSGPPSNRGSHAPSPLSLPYNNTASASHLPGNKAPASPLGRPPLSINQFSASQPDVSLSNGTDGKQQSLPGRILGIRQVSSSISLKTGRSASPLATPTSTTQPVRRNSGPPGQSAVTSSPPSAAPSAMERLRRISSGSKKHQRTLSQQSRSSSNSETRSIVASPPLISGSLSSSSPIQRTNSLKSKLSLPHLRIRNNGGKDGLRDIQSPSPSTAPATPIFDFDNQPETVQVKDAEFEMIRPTMRRISSEPTSDDSLREERPSIQQETRPDSPASVTASSRSVGGSRSPIPGGSADAAPELPHIIQPVEDSASVEAHRARELKWISAMSSVPAPQARKSKKIKRLVLEGVPSSVRYLVWAHLTDSKAKRTPGVYGQLGKRGKVAATEAIERDAQRCFPDQPHLQDTKGPLVNLLQTYLTMVPDIEYQTSLAVVAGHLLLQSPEEDAFWTFVSMMDVHLRPYFSPKAVQMEADASVFSKTVEAMNPQLAKKLFVELGIAPVEICRLWFSSVFAMALPRDYVNRVWDVYLCEGPSFLFRVALALLSSCRSAIENFNDRTAVLALLARPETRSLLPHDPEMLINIALAVKLKDDDVKKQRLKVEAQLKRQTQSTQRSAPMLASSISLPRA